MLRRFTPVLAWVYIDCGKGGAYATLLDADERGILIAPHEATTDEPLPVVYVVWSEVHAIRQRQPAQSQRVLHRPLDRPERGWNRRGWNAPGRSLFAAR